MAPSHGTSNTGTSARKRLIKPVLPALPVLPLPPKVNKQTPKVEDQENRTAPATNGVKDEDQLVTDTSTLRLAETGVLLEYSDSGEPRTEHVKVVDKDPAAQITNSEGKLISSSSWIFLADC